MGGVTPNFARCDRMFVWTTSGARQVGQLDAHRVGERLAKGVPCDRHRANGACERFPFNFPRADAHGLAIDRQRREFDALRTPQR